MSEGLEREPVFPGGSRLESPESGLALYIKELLPNGGKVGLSSLSQFLTEGRPPWGREQNQRGGFPCLLGPGPIILISDENVLDLDLGSTDSCYQCQIWGLSTHRKHKSWPLWPQTGDKKWTGV